MNIGQGLEVNYLSFEVMEYLERHGGEFLEGENNIGGKGIEILSKKQSKRIVRLCECMSLRLGSWNW